MMRSLYSAVSGLKTHQTKMDVIGNNISNVNTVAFKSSSVTFSSIMYQTISSASGANETTGTGGVNAKQIGLGVTTGSTTVSITSAGAAETTGRPFDLKITDKSTSSFFIVNNGSENVFTKAGSFYVDGSGNLCMSSTGYTVQGWGVDQNTGTIRKDTVSALKIMSADNQTSSPEATTKASCSGVVDNNSTQMTSETGYPMSLLIYDNLGYQYTAKFAIQAVDTQTGKYAVNLTDIIDSKGNSILNSKVSLKDLFGPGANSSTQGSGVNITDNYSFNPSKSKSDIKDAIKAKATTPPATQGGTATVKYTYALDAADVNAQLELNGNGALPEGYTVVFESGNTTLSSVKSELAPTTGTGQKAYIKDASGRTVAEGTYDSANDEWKFVDYDLTKTPPVATTNPSAYQLNNTITIDKLVKQGLGTEVTDASGEITGYKFSDQDLADLLEQLGIDPKAPGNEKYNVDELYYWPDYDGTNPITNANGDTFEGVLCPPNTNDAAKLIKKLADLPVNKYGIEELIQDYSYTSINGADLSTQTADDPIFTEQLPSDAIVKYNMFTGSYSIITPKNEGFTLQFNTVDGTLDYIGSANTLSQSLNLSKLSAAGYDGFEDVTIDFSSLLNYNNKTSSTAAMDGGDANGIGKGKKLGALTGLTVDPTGKIYGSYDNGNTVLLGQIAVAQFANAAGLEATGDNCYRTTLNSGDFDGIGVEISADGSSISTGELEMSNVDLSSEFTSMITTQRGFQANSRVITVSDTLLEELTNLKR